MKDNLTTTRAALDDSLTHWPVVGLELAHCYRQAELSVGLGHDDELLDDLDEINRAVARAVLHEVATGARRPVSDWLEKGPAGRLVAGPPVFKTPVKS